MAGTELSRTAAAITERARMDYDPEQVKLIKHTIMPPESNNAELALFLEISARYSMDPFAKQIWAIRYKGKVQIIISAAGWLALANREPDFRGVQSFELREFDHFERTIDDAGHVHVVHEMLDSDGKPTHGGRDGKLRGEIIGGFAYLRREGHVDQQFLAYSAQYDQHQNAWATHPTAMHHKVAEAMVLRKSYPISGVYSEYELPADAPVTELTRPGTPIAIDYGPDEELAEKLRQAFGFLGYRHAKVRTVMRGATTQEARERLLVELSAQAEAEVADAEIVPDAAA